MKMPKKIKRKWLKALRSGTYRQGKDVLYNPDTVRFCCLGVLQHCVSGGSVEVSGIRSTYFKGRPSVRWYVDNGIEVTAINSYSVDEDETELIKMNDGGKRFSRIADWIEKNIQTTD